MCVALTSAQTLDWPPRQTFVCNSPNTAFFNIMRPGSRAAILLLLTCFFGLSACWTKEDHEIFRLKDEVQANEGSNTTFYSFMGLKENANQKEINDAYKKLSRSLHPDKARSKWLASYNVPKKPNTKSGAKPTVHVQKDKKPSQSEINRFTKEASARFQRLSLVANVLRGPERDRYDHFLLNGFPAWRGTGYYYQRFRPGLGTVLAGLFVFVGGGVHYAASLPIMETAKRVRGALHQARSPHGMGR